MSHSLKPCGLIEIISKKRMKINYPVGIKQPKVKRLSKSKAPKYGNRKVVLDGVMFDSKIEARYYQQLKTLKLKFKYHESFEIVPKFKLNGKTYQHRVYTPDFTIYEGNELVSVIDCKGGSATLTDASRLRMVLFMQKYQVPVVIATWDSKLKVFHEEIK